MSKKAASAAVGMATAMFLNERMIRKRSEEEGKSLLKYAAFRAEIANLLFRADMLKGVVGWAKMKTAGEIITDLVRFKALQGEIMSMLNIDISQPDDAAIKDRVNEVIFMKKSNVYLAEHDNTQPELKALFSDLGLWANSDTPLQTPQAKKIESSISLRDIFLSLATTEVLAKNAKDDAVKTPEEIHQQIKVALEAMKGAPDQKSAKGSSTHASIDEAIGLIGAGTFKYGEYVNYDEKLKPGSQLAYEFSGGALHHAVYVGSMMVVEVQNYDMGEGKGVEAFVVINHLYNFLQRTGGNASDVYTVPYENPLPPEVVTRRALWSVGKYPSYHLTRENCESVASWIVSNSYESSMCVIRPPSKPTMQGGKRIRTWRKKVRMSTSIRTGRKRLRS